MKRRAALVLTCALLAGVVVWSRRDSRRSVPAPESVVWRLLERSRAGDSAGYLDCFTEATRAQLDSTARSMTAEAFSAYVRGSVARVKGVAVYDLERVGQDAARLVVEYVYPEQNERQRMRLKLESGTWRIAAAEPSQRVQPRVPYGMPAAEEP